MHALARVLHEVNIQCNSNFNEKQIVLMTQEKGTQRIEGTSKSREGEGTEEKLRSPLISKQAPESNLTSGKVSITEAISRIYVI